MDDGIFELDSALLCDPPLARPAVIHIALARAYVAKQDKGHARGEVDAALKLEPKNAEALELDGKLKGKKGK